MEFSLAETRTYEKAWEKDPTPVTFEQYGTFAAAFLANKSGHWFSGEHRAFGCGSFVIFTFDDHDERVLTIKDKLVQHVIGCSPCAAQLQECQLVFAENVRKSGISIEALRDVSSIINTKLTRIWTEKADAALALTDIPAVITCLVGYLNSADLPFTAQFPRLLEYYDEDVQHQVQEGGQFAWAPGYLVVLAQDPQVPAHEFIAQKLSTIKIKPSPIELAVFTRIFAQLPWKDMAAYLRALDGSAKPFTDLVLQHLQAIPITLPVAEGLLGMPFDLQVVAAHFARHTIAYPQSYKISAQFLKMVRDAQAQAATLGTLSSGPNEQTRRILCLAILDDTKDLADAQRMAPFLVGNIDELASDSVQQLARLIELEIFANEGAPLLEACVSVFEKSCYNAAKPIIFSSLMMAVALPAFSNPQQQLEQSPVPRAIMAIISKFGDMDATTITSCCTKRNTLACLWLFKSCTNQNASDLAEIALDSTDTGRLGLPQTFAQIKVAIAFIRERRMVSIGSNFCELITLMLSLVPVATPPQLIEFWTEFWQLLELLWSVDHMQKCGYSNASIKGFLRYSSTAASEVVAKFEEFMPALTGEHIEVSLGVLAEAITPGRKLLYLQRNSGVLVLVFSVFEKAVRLLVDYKFPVPEAITKTLMDVVAGTPANEVLSNERALLRELLGMPEAPASAAQSPLPMAATAPPMAKPAPKPPASSFASFFKKVSRDEAVASVQKQMPPKHPEPPKEMSHLEQVREKMNQNRFNNPPPPLKASTVIHPARPAGFNRRERADHDKPTKLGVAGGPSAASSDSDSSSSDSDSGLFKLGSKRRIRNIEMVDGVKKSSLRPPQADEKAQALARMKARMLVTPTQMHKDVLCWSFFQDGLYPPNAPRNLKVPDKFQSAEHYLSIMGPLLLMETWMQIQRQKEVREETLPVIFGKREHVDQFVDFYVTMPTQVYQRGHFTENDLVLLSVQSEEQLERTTREMPNSLAKIREGSIQFRQKTVDFVLRTFRAEHFTNKVHQKSFIGCERVCSLVTMEREYCALEALPHNELKRQILEAEPAQSRPAPESTIAQYSAKLGLNESQAQAVHQAISSPGINLIQGPPGTGKTKTILGIIGTYFTNLAVVGKRILVCAPSNAAVDELLMRLRRGVHNSRGELMNLKLVRLGRPETANAQVADLCLERQIEATVTSVAANVDSGLRGELQELETERRAIFASLDGEQESNESEKLTAEQVSERTNKIARLKVQIDEKRSLLQRQREQLDTSRKTREVEYKRKQAEILSNAQIVCSTLSGSANSLLSSLELHFSTVIIDEAAQCVELSALIPLRYGCQQCIMVGDPHQLPPTVLSKAAAELKYEQSLFTRIFNQHPSKVSMLDVQFRMHPEIAVFPSQEFYSGKLQTGPEMAVTTKRPWHERPEFGPYNFFSLVSTEMSRVRNSLVNYKEIEVCVALVDRLLGQFPTVDFTGRIGVVTPYKQHNNSMRDAFKHKFGNSIVDQVSFSTIDAFQGQEKDIIIFSTVRASSSSNTIGFVGDIRRMNVAITRARSSLWIVGASATLGANEEWSRLIKDCQARGKYVGVNLDMVKTGRFRWSEPHGEARQAAGARQPSRSVFVKPARGPTRDSRGPPREPHHPHDRSARAERDRQPYPELSYHEPTADPERPLLSQGRGDSSASGDPRDATPEQASDVTPVGETRDSSLGDQRSSPAGALAALGSIPAGGDQASRDLGPPSCVQSTRGDSNPSGGHDSSPSGDQGQRGSPIPSDHDRHDAIKASDNDPGRELYQPLSDQASTRDKDSHGRRVSLSSDRPRRNSIPPRDSGPRRDSCNYRPKSKPPGYRGPDSRPPSGYRGPQRDSVPPSSYKGPRRDSNPPSGYRGPRRNSNGPSSSYREPRRDTHPSRYEASARPSLATAQPLEHVKRNGQPFSNPKSYKKRKKEKPKNKFPENPHIRGST